MSEENETVKLSVQDSKEFIASFMEKMEQARKAQVEAELAMAGIMEGEKDTEIALLRAQLEEKEADQSVVLAEVKFMLTEMKYKAFSLVGWLIILAILLGAMGIIAAMNYNSCWYVWGEVMPLSFWVEHLLIGCAP